MATSYMGNYGMQLPKKQNLWPGISGTQSQNLIGDYSPVPPGIPSLDGLNPQTTMAGLTPNAASQIGWGADMGFMDKMKSWWDKTPLMDTYDPATNLKTQGMGSLALSGAQALTGAYLGMKNYGLAKKTFNENKRQFDVNFDAQRTNVNAQLEDRQRARVAGSAGQVSVEDYMNKNRIK